ncbi:MAG: hypothetical protein RLZZ271_941 [Pseudomonadota bacterium]|jgi:hypothetical protein
MQKTASRQERICVAGFPFSEKNKFDKFLRATARSIPSWGVTDCIDEATIIILNVREKFCIEEWKSMIVQNQQVLIVGPDDFGTGWSVMSRPFQLGQITERLKQLTVSRHHAVGG